MKGRSAESFVKAEEDFLWDSLMQFETEQSAESRNGSQGETRERLLTQTLKLEAQSKSIRSAERRFVLFYCV